MERVLFVILAATHPLCYEAFEYQEIRLAAPIYHLRAQNFGEKFSILHSKPLNIVFEGFCAKTVQCQPHNKQRFGRRGKIIPGNGTTIYRIDEITNDMSAKWKCDLIGSDNSKSVYTFEIRIKAAKMVSAYIDKTLLQYTLTNESVLEYDGVNEYLCEEGVTINLECQNPFMNGSLTLKYYNADGSKVFETDYVDKVKDFEDKLTFRVLMSLKANRSYVECTYLTSGKHENRQEFTYRINFIISKDPIKNEYFTITINDMKLTSNPKKVNGIDIYHYDFIYGEDLMITCETKDKNIVADIEMGTKISPTMRRDTYIHTKDLDKTQSVYKLFVETTYLDRAQMEFDLYDSASNEFLRAIINFYVGSFNGPAIVGLPANNMLYQYSKNNKEWVAHYQYTPNETLCLTCIAIGNITTLRWFQGNKLVDMTKRENNKVGIKYIRDMITLNENDITCQLADKGKESWTLIFHRKLHENISDNATDVPQKLFVIIGSTMGVLLVIAITAIYLFYLHRRHIIKKHKEPSMTFSGTDNPILDIVNHNNGEYAYITNEYNYIKSNDSDNASNSLYCRYMSDNMSSKRDMTYSGESENHYTEIDDYFRNTDKFNPTNKISDDNNESDYETSNSGPTYNNL